MKNVTNVGVRKELEQAVLTMIESIFHFFRIRGKMIFGNTSVDGRGLLGRTPKALNAVTVILSTVNLIFRMIHFVPPPTLEKKEGQSIGGTIA